MKTLIVIDMQNDFVTGPLGTPEARAIVPNIKNKIEFYKILSREQKTNIIFTQDSHSKKYGNEEYLIEEKKVPKHCITGTPGWCIIDELFPYSISTIEKETFGVTKWVSTRMDDNDEESSIQIVGVCTDICVISNALILRAMYPNIPIIVDASCCAGTTPEKHKAALEVMKSCCIEVINE